MDLPCDDDNAWGSRRSTQTRWSRRSANGLDLMPSSGAQSLAGFVAPRSANVWRWDLLVLVAGMVPRPGESPG